MFGACLPTIITLVIFIIAISGFNAYSSWQNKKYFYDMSIAYNNVLYAGLEIDGEYIYVGEDGAITVNDAKILEKGATFTPDGKDYEIIISGKTDTGFTLETTGGYIKYTLSNGSKTFTVTDLSKIINPDYNNGLKNSDGKTFAEVRADNPELTAEEFLSSVGSYRAAETFKNNGAKFLWVKNIWVTDSPTKHPVEKEWKSFQSTYGYKGDDVIDIEAENGGYTKLIAELTDEISAPNGYFILVALTALSSLLMQFVMGKSQKAQMELQTVDGQGAQTQKIMTWMMPIMMAVFAFIYTAAFSLYIIISSVISLLTTLLINFIADRKFKPKETGDAEVIRGRVYIPPKKEEQPAKKKKKDKTAEDGFLSGLADKKKHPRGRLK